MEIVLNDGYTPMGGEYFDVETGALNLNGQDLVVQERSTYTPTNRDFQQFRVLNNRAIV